MRYLRLAALHLAIWATFFLACGRPPPREPPVVVAERDASSVAPAAVEAGAPEAPRAASPLPPEIRLRRRGVNLSGAEFTGGGSTCNVPGTFGRDYTWPSAKTVDWFVDRGFNHFRVPFKHERLQPKLQAPLDDAELARMKALVAHATGRGATVLLDAQNSYRHGAGCCASAKADPKCRVLTEAEAGDFWGRVAREFKDNPLVQINATNEPHDMTTEQVLALGQAVVREVRRVGFAGLVAVPGNGWAGSVHWAERFNGTTPSSEVMGRIAGENVAFDVHLYLDADASGTGKECVSPTVGAERLAAFVAWLRANGRRGVLGEIGAPATPTCGAAVKGALSVVEANYDVFESWAWWNAGEWSAATNALSLGGPSAGEKPQLAWVASFLPCARALDGGAPAP